ncbi:MAG: DNA internalization-related competence protein ComEC/Rec2, partial [Clostridia bacterium]|nr:DNA internalization-related competence protein ComEC/Rec2 [Clostridia bacterium]
YVTVTADLIKEPERKEGYAVLYAELTSVSFLGKTLPLQEKVRLTVGGKENIPAFGDSFEAICLFSLPKEADNWGDFDYQLYLKSQKIYFTGKVEAGTLHKTGQFSLGLTERLYQLNRHCFRLLERRMPQEAAAVLQAMALGDTSGFTDDFRDNLKVSGLSHVTAVSGMHVSTLVSMLYILFSVLGQNRYKFIWLTGGVIIFFMLFTGASPSVVRAAIMGIMTLLAYIFFRREDKLTSLGVAAAVIVMLNPPAALHTGFLLSFAATLGLLLFAEPIQNGLLRLVRPLRHKAWLYKSFRAVFACCAVTLSAQIFIFPVSAYLFGTFSVYTFITNLPATVLAPFLLCGGLVTVLFELFVPWLALLPAGFTYPFVKLFVWLVSFFGNRPSGLLTVGSFSCFALYVYGLLVYAFARMLQRSWKQFAAVVLSVVILAACGLVYTGFRADTVRLTFINVGHADSSLLRLPGGVTVLIDGGGQPAYAGDYDIGTEVLLPYLKRNGIRQIDYMLATHPHEDHIEGLYSLLGQIKTKCLVIPIGFCDLPAGEELTQKAKDYGVEIIEVSSGDRIDLADESFLEVVSPDTNWLERAETENDRCLSVRFTFGSVRAFFAADLEKAAELYLKEVRPALLSADILKVAHHGSDSSSHPAFLETVRPKYAYIPCGQNTFGHPADSVLAAFNAVGTQVYRADLDKDVTFMFDKTEIFSVQKGAKP